MLEKIREDMKKALKEKNEVALSALRLLLSEIKNAEIEKRGKLEEGEIINIIRRSIKKRKEAIELFEKGGREKLVAKEKKEIEVLSKYLPKELSAEEIEKIVGEIAEEVGAMGPSDIGKVMRELMSRFRGRIDGKLAKEIVEKKLKGEAKENG
ncbi:MAG: GatB/YqeY domain-containing protein [Acidobacteria bacterium]|nr:GatB/YqeY domain-containing protein [Acidobacteriota bacterium]